MLRISDVLLSDFSLEPVSVFFFFFFFTLV